MCPHSILCFPFPRIITYYVQYLCQIVDSMETRTKYTLLLTVARVFNHSAQDRKGIQQTFID